jgi:hypothetical protein
MRELNPHLSFISGIEPAFNFGNRTQIIVCVMKRVKSFRLTDILGNRTLTRYVGDGLKNGYSLEKVFNHMAPIWLGIKDFFM